MTPSPLRLDIDLGALAANWRTMARLSGSAACGAAVKADGYGIGARKVVERLAREGCRDFFVATCAEGAAFEPWPEGLSLAVLHGVGPGDMPAALASRARPILVSGEQVARWRDTGRPCDLMVDTGLNRLGLAASELAAADGLRVDTLHSHLACADEPEHSFNGEQLRRFLAIDFPAARRSFANSAGIALGPDYAFDLTRPGLALYGGEPVPIDGIRQVVRPFAQVVQVRDVSAGSSVGYGATFVATQPMRVAVLNIGYADGYLRAFSSAGRALHNGGALPVLGRVSMDLTAIDATNTPLREGDWVEMDFDLPRASAITGLSQYELLTCLGDRYHRRYS